MVYRSCVYKGCDNFTYDYVPCGTRKFTIFRFPKDPKRCELWMKLGRVPDGLPESQMLMCSDHFDDKYLIKNHRRTSLISTAIPFPYYEASNDIDNIGKEREEATDNSLDTEMVFSIQDLNDESALIRLKESACEDDVDCGMLDYGKVDNQSETEYCVESTTMKDTNEHLADLLEDYEVASDLEEKIFTEVVTQSEPREDVAKNYKTNIGKKRKLNSDIDDNQEPTSSKALITKIIAQAENGSSKQENVEHSKHMRQQNKKPSTPEPDARQIDPESLVDLKAVTCFIFKGEEYVQMPKEYYILEKFELMEKLKRYENTLRSFKQNLLDLDLP